MDARRHPRAFVRGPRRDPPGLSPPATVGACSSSRFSSAAATKAPTPAAVSPTRTPTPIPTATPTRTRTRTPTRTRTSDADSDSDTDSDTDTDTDVSFNGTAPSVPISAAGVRGDQPRRVRARSRRPDGPPDRPVVLPGRVLGWLNDRGLRVPRPLRGLPGPRGRRSWAPGSTRRRRTRHGRKQEDSSSSSGPTTTRRSGMTYGALSGPSDGSVSRVTMLLDEKGELLLEYTEAHRPGDAPRRGSRGLRDPVREVGRSIHSAAAAKSFDIESPSLAGLNPEH